MLFIILTLVVGERTIAPLQKPIYELIPHTQYSTNVQSTLLLQYNSYPGVYSMELGQVRDGEYQRMIANKTLDPFMLEGCYPYDRRLIYKHLVQQHVDQGYYFFTNMYIDQNTVFVTRSDNQLLIFKIETDDQEREVIDLKEVGTYAMNGTSDSHTIVCQNQNCVIFTEDRAYMYRDQKFTNLTLQQYPIDVYFDEKDRVLFLSYGQNTVDIYLFEEKGTLLLLKTLTVQGKIVQTRTNPEGTKLYLLDQERGLLMYNMPQLYQYEDSGFLINLRNGDAFDFYEDTFFIVARTNDNIPYALEIFVNQKDYYFNKIYSKDMDIFDVWVGEHFAILIGSEVHRVIYHSVYNKIIAESETPLFFQDLDLVNVEEYKPLQWNSTIYLRGAIEQDPFQKAQIHYKQSFMVGISRNDLSIFAIKNISPWLQCKPPDTTSVHYSLKLNSTTCSTKQHENDHSPFRQCHITHNFTLTGNQVLFYQEDRSMVLIVGCLLGQFVQLISAVILLLIIAVIAAKKYYKYRLDKFIIDANSPRPLDEVDFETSPEEQMVVQ